jgi:hypothetical protein
MLKKIVSLTLLTTAIATSTSSIVFARSDDLQPDLEEPIIVPETIRICFGKICLDL